MIVRPAEVTLALELLDAMASENIAPESAAMIGDGVRKLLELTEKQELALRNCLTHARMQSRKALREERPEDSLAWMHIIRFCAAAGVVPQILRGEGTEDLVCSVAATVQRVTRSEQALLLEVQVDDPEAFLRLHAGSEVHVSIMVSER